jgi:hypothetical protein
LHLSHRQRNDLHRHSYGSIWKAHTYPEIRQLRGHAKRRRDCQDTLPGDQPGGERVDHADTRLESSAQSVRHPVWRQGAGVNTSYTVNLTPPICVSTVNDTLRIFFFLNFVNGCGCIMILSYKLRYKIGNFFWRSKQG